MQWVESLGSSVSVGRGYSEIIVQLLYFLPLASAAELSALSGVPLRQVWRILKELRERDCVSCVSIGWSQSPVFRYWLLPPVFVDGVSPPAFFHLDGGLERLLDRLPLVEAFYSVLLRETENLGSLVDFYWFDGVSFDAVARFERGWFCLLWSGLCQSHSFLGVRLSSIVTDFQRLSEERSEPVRPACLYFVVSDLWQGEIVQRAVGDSGLAGLSRFAFLPESVFWGEPLEPDSSTGYLTQESRYRSRQDPNWARFVSRHISSSGLRPDVSSYILDYVAQWPSVEYRELLRAFRSVDGRRRVSLEKFLSGALFKREGNTVSLSSLGAHQLRRRDGVPDNFSFATLGPPVVPRMVPHERGLRSVMSSFAADFCETAVGTRSYESLPGAGISPDGLVYFGESPFGPGWHYVEYERRVRGAARVAAKLKGYLAKPAAVRFPLLMVCRDSDTEALFTQVASSAEPGFQMALTTLSEATESARKGHTGTWRVNGCPVTFS